MIATQSVLTKPRVRDFSNLPPIPDPPRVPDMMEQAPTIATFLTVIGAWVRNRKDVFVGSGGYLWLTIEDGDGPFPDGSFAYGLEDPEWLLHRNGYVVSEVGKPPDLVFEVGSASTGRNDYTTKRDTYAEYGIREYWRFDPSGGEYHDAALAGDVLVDGKYEPLEIVREADGRYWGYSEVLELEFWWDGGELRFRDPVSGEFLRTLNESEDALEESEGALASEREARESAESRAAFAEYRAESAETRADAEAAARRQAEIRAEAEVEARRAESARVAELEAELRRLRGE